MGWQGIRPTDFALKMIEESEDHVKKVATVGFQSVVVGSPVMDGHYRGSHILTINSEDHSYNPSNLDTDGSTTTNKALKELTLFKLGSIIRIQTNAPHGPRLENGWSDQAPLGVYSIAYMNMRTV